MAKYKSNFSRRDLFFTFAAIVFALMNLGAIGSRGRSRDKEAVCLSNLRQWGAIFDNYTKDNNGYFCDTGDGGWIRAKWLLEFIHLLETRENLFLCPEAPQPFPYEVNYGGPFNAYIIGKIESKNRLASYGANCWIYNSLPGQIAIQGRPTKWNWKTPYVKGGNNIPVLADTMWRGGGPREFGSYGDPPNYDGEWSGYNKEMKHFCINRHNGAVNYLFMDWSVRKVGLKELWKLKWHRAFNTDGRWTLAGGIQQRDWPQWMRNFKDY